MLFNEVGQIVNSVNIIIHYYSVNITVVTSAILIIAHLLSALQLAQV